MCFDKAQPPCSCTPHTERWSNLPSKEYQIVRIRLYIRYSLRLHALWRTVRVQLSKLIIEHRSLTNRRGIVSYGLLPSKAHSLQGLYTHLGSICAIALWRLFASYGVSVSRRCCCHISQSSEAIVPVRISSRKVLPTTLSRHSCFGTFQRFGRRFRNFS